MTEAFRIWLPQYAGEVQSGSQTGERNVLPFIRWLSSRAGVETFPSEDPMEAIGVNTPGDLERLERYLTR